MRVQMKEIEGLTKCKDKQIQKLEMTGLDF